MCIRTRPFSHLSYVLLWKIKETLTSLSCKMMYVDMFVHLIAKSEIQKSLIIFKKRFENVTVVM